MKIIVFIDQIVNTQVKLQGVDYFDSSKVNEDDLVINPNSKNAIEGALKLQDSIGAEVTAVCVKGLKPNKAVKEAIAMGCKAGIEFIDDQLYSEDPYIVAKVYAKILEKINDYDLVFLGVEEQSAGSFAEAAMLSEILNLPSVLYAEEMEVLDNSIKVGHVLEGGRKIVEMPKKGIISCSDSQHFIPRYTSMKGILNAKRAIIPVWSSADIDIEGNEIAKESSSLKAISLSNIVIEKDTFIIKEGDPEEMVDELLTKLKADEVKLGA